MELLTIPQMVWQNTATHAASVAFQTKRDGVYHRITFSEAGVMIENMAAALHAMGIRPGDRVALLSENRPEWAISYLAIICAGAIVVPLDALIEEDSLKTLLENSGSRCIVISGRFLDLIEKNKNDLPELKFIVNLDQAQNQEHIYSYQLAVHTTHQRESIGKIGLDEIAAIVYTSGTTGVSKGVMLSHRNIMSNVQTMCSLIDVGPTDNLLSVLPLHHTFECTAGFLTPYYVGARITYAESLKSYQLLANMQETGTTIMLAVPLLYRLFYEGIIRDVHSKGPAAVAVFSFLQFISRFFKIVLHKNIGSRLFGMLHKKLGGKTRFWVAGGAAMDPEVILGFEAFGITILQGYGLTETSPIISACTLKHNRIGSVGKPLPGVEVKILNPDNDDIGEIVVRGPNVMQGYYKRPDLTKEILRDGWLYTGDLGFLDEHNYLYITGRSKNLIVTGAGVNVYPEEIEFYLNRNPFIKESCVLGVKLEKGIRKGGEEIIAVVVPEHDYFEIYLKQKEIIVSNKIM
ncbi:MAG: AMP-binding protein, partial [Candidatus Margulisbacteria bacterium]|nr:AMP-binding protein [Candidatus Margulisiibacteriota bacterium]